MEMKAPTPRPSRSGRTLNSSGAKSEKVTFVLPAPLALQMRQAVDRGSAVSQNALIRDAIAREVKRLRNEEIDQSYQEAAADPLYMGDLHECLRDFDSIDAESARLLAKDDVDLGEEAR